jgi:hypothetical protein
MLLVWQLFTQAPLRDQSKLHDCLLGGRCNAVPLLASKVSYKLLPSVCLARSALRCRLASNSCCAASHSSLLSIGASTVPPETKPEDMAVSFRGSCPMSDPLHF